MINLKVQAGDGGEDATDFAQDLIRLIEKQAGVVSANGIFYRL